MTFLKNLFKLQNGKNNKVESIFTGVVAIILITTGIRNIFYYWLYYEEIKEFADPIWMSIIIILIGVYYLADYFFIRNKVSFRAPLAQITSLFFIIFLIYSPYFFDLGSNGLTFEPLLCLSWFLFLLLIPLSLVYFEKRDIKTINYFFRISIYLSLTGFLLSYIVYIYGTFEFYFEFAGIDMVEALLSIIYHSFFSDHFIIILMIFIVLILNKTIAGPIKIFNKNV